MPKEYIEREAVDAAIKAAADRRKAIGVPGEQAGFLQAHDIVRSFPAADVVERKKGMWGRNKNNGLLYCPFCDSVAPAEDQHGEMIFRPPFCHQCGSDLREGKDG